MVEKIQYKDSIIHMRKINANWNSNPRYCFCCIQPIKNGVAIAAINNYKYIPNMLMHENCFSEWETKTDELFSDMEKSWSKYKTLDKIFG